MNLLNELKRRNVFKVAGVYAVVAWLLMQLASTLESSLNLPIWFDSVITVSLFIGFPIALLLAWAFEMTPEGVKKTGDLEEGASSSSTGKMDILILIGIVAVLGLGVWQQMSPKQLDSRLRGNDEVVFDTPVIPAKVGISEGETDDIQDNSIAVLPFTDLSPDGDQEYFSDGIAEEILNVLVRVDVLQVTSRTSAFQFKGSNKGIPAIAKELKVRHVLEGSVRKSGETIRITAQLIDARNDKHLWSETYDRPLTTENIFAIQDEISNAIVQALGAELGIEKIEKINITTSTDNLTAYELYLKARPLFLARSDLDIADAYLIKAIELDENYAKAWEMRAALQKLMHDYGYSDKSNYELDLLGKQFALKAMEIEPNSALAKSTLGNLQMWVTTPSDYISKSIALYNESIEIDPNLATTYNWRGLAYSMVGMLDQAEKDFRHCLKLEPLYSACYTNVVTNAMIQDFQSSTKILTQGLIKDIVNIQYIDLFWLAQHKKEDLFMVVINHKLNLAGWGRGDELYQAYLHPEKNHRQLIDDILAFYKSNHSEDPVSFALQLLLVPIGAYEITPPAATMWGMAYKTYRQSPEFKAYVIKNGIYQYWLETGFPPQCRPLGENNFECD